MNDRLNDYLEYLYVTDQLDNLIINALVKKYNNIFGELDEDFFCLELEEQYDLLAKSLKYKIKILKK